MDFAPFTDAKNQIMQEALEDDLGLWWIIAELKDRVPKSLLQTVVLWVIAECLKAGAVVGQFQQGVFYRWELPVETIIETIKSEWDGLGRDPNLGEVAWLVVPPAKTYVV